MNRFMPAFHHFSLHHPPLLLLFRHSIQFFSIYIIDWTQKFEFHISVSFAAALPFSFCFIDVLLSSSLSIFWILLWNNIWDIYVYGYIPEPHPPHSLFRPPHSVILLARTSCRRSLFDSIRIRNRIRFWIEIDFDCIGWLSLLGYHLSWDIGHFFFFSHIEFVWLHIFRSRVVVVIVSIEQQSLSKKNGRRFRSIWSNEWMVDWFEVPTVQYLIEVREVTFNWTTGFHHHVVQLLLLWVIRFHHAGSCDRLEESTIIIKNSTVWIK